MYTKTEEGFIIFILKIIKNIYFLPDYIEFLQVRLHFLFRYNTFLETIREILFIGLVIYSQIILRITLSWFIYINPYRYRGVM
jgi:hypothetical protein